MDYSKLRTLALTNLPVLFSLVATNAHAGRVGDFLNPPPTGPVIVNIDHGGFLRDYESQLAFYRMTGREVRINGLCNSSCTSALDLGEKVCVTRNARLGFHLGYLEVRGSDGKKRKDATQTPDVAEGSNRLFGHYPAAVQARLGGLAVGMKYLSGTEVIHLGVRECGRSESAPVVAARIKQPAGAPAAQASAARGQQQPSWFESLFGSQTPPSAQVVPKQPHRKLHRHAFWLAR
jgi:hypothetical protein